MKKLKVLDLFSGTQSIAKAFRENGHETFTVELDKKHDGIDWYEDIMNIEADDILERFGRPDVIWASPPCEKFSVAAIGRHWIKGTNLPKTEETEKALKLLEHTVKLIHDLNPTVFYIENPRGKMRKMDVMQSLDRHTVTYCQYGDTRMKPTDIWTNHPCPNFVPPHVKMEVRVMKLPHEVAARVRKDSMGRQNVPKFQKVYAIMLLKLARNL